MNRGRETGIDSPSGTGRKLENEFSWSISRHRIFLECPRAYYFRHYGSWGGWEPDADPHVREAYLLKRLTNRFAFAGSVVHEVVAGVFNRHRYGREVTAAEAKDRALDLLRRGFRESRDGAYREGKAVGLFEHEYEEDIGKREWERIRDRVFRCLDNFFSSDIRRIVLETRIENWLPVDAMDAFPFEGTRVYVAPDFALKNPQGNALVIDWKTGRPGSSGDRLQIVCYGLFAREKWGVEPQRAIGELHYLWIRDVVIVTLDEDALLEGMETIRGSIAAMKGLLVDPESNRAVMNDFPQTENRLTCRRCNYRRLCWPNWPELLP